MAHDGHRSKARMTGQAAGDAHSTGPLQLAGKSAGLDALPEHLSVRFTTERARGEAEEEESAVERATSRRACQCQWDKCEAKGRMAPLFSPGLQR